MSNTSSKPSRANIAIDVYLRLTRMFVCCGPPANR